MTLTPAAAPEQAPEQVDRTAVRRLPAMFAPYAAEPIVQMPAAARGKTAFLQLHFERRGDKTRLIRNYSGGHQVVRQVHYMDDALGDMAVVIIQSVSAGVLQGDRLRVEINVGAGARVLVTTQAAMKVYVMEANYASHRVDISLGAGSYAEVLMEPLIVYSGARFYNEINVQVDPTATLVYDEHLTPGRVAHGEEWQFDLLYSRFRCTRPGGALIVSDTNVLTPKQHPVTVPGLFGDASDMGVMYVVAEGHHDQQAMADAMHASLQHVDGVTGSASVLPSSVGVHARALGTSTSRTQGAMHACWAAARRELLGVGIPPIHRAKHGFEPTITRES